jgi:hypothetical protein
MDFFTMDALRSLTAPQERPCVSIYMHGVKAGDEVRQNPIRFKNLLKQAEETMVEGGYRGADVGSFLEPAYDLLVNEMFWQNLNEGFVVFISTNQTRYYRLPVAFDDMVMMGDSFYIKPLMPLLSNNGRFFLLALSQQSIRLLEGTRDSIDQIETGDLPQNLPEALRWDDPEPQLQHHASEGPSTFGGKGATFHGHGVGQDDRKNDILRYFQKVDRALKGILAGESAPLVLAAVDYLHSIYHEANTYPNLLEKGLTGNPDLVKKEELHQEAWQIVEPLFGKEQEQAAALFQQYQGSEHATEDLASIVSAAVYGQVSHLFVETGTQMWGMFDRETGQVEFHEEQTPESSDLLDVAVSHTFLNGGEVYAVSPEELPASGPAAAVLRWPE